MTTQTELLRNMERDFKITRKLFLNIKTGWFDNSRKKSNLVYAKDIAINQIQGRYRLNLNDNELKIQEFFFDIEWSAFTEGNKKIEVITKEIVDSYFPRLKKAAKKLLFTLLKYIPKDYIYIRASGSGFHIIFFLKGLKDMDEWELITRYIICKARLPNTKNAEKLVFGEHSSGPSHDLEVATSLVKQMVMYWGMSKKFGPRIFGERTGSFLCKNFIISYYT